MLKYSEKFGDLYRLWFGKHLILVISNAEDLQVRKLILYFYSKTCEKMLIFHFLLRQYFLARKCWINQSCVSHFRNFLEIAYLLRLVSHSSEVMLCGIRVPKIMRYLLLQVKFLEKLYSFRTNLEKTTKANTTSIYEEGITLL